VNEFQIVMSWHQHTLLPHVKYILRLLLTLNCSNNIEKGYGLFFKEISIFQSLEESL
jgi:hypothetical protein